MAEDLQGLLKRINEEGIKKTEAERDELLAEAKARAEQIVKDAQARADQIVSDAQQERDKLVQAGEDKLKQASRDVVVSLEAELKELITAFVRQSVRETMDKNFIAKLILTLAEGYASRKGDVTGVEVLVADNQLEELETFLKAELGKHFSDGVTIAPVGGIDAGVQVSFDGESVYHDFSDDAIVEMIGAYANPRLLKLLREPRD